MNDLDLFSLHDRYWDMTLKGSRKYCLSSGSDRVVLGAWATLYNHRISQDSPFHAIMIPSWCRPTLDFINLENLSQTSGSLLALTIFGSWRCNLWEALDAASFHTALGPGFTYSSNVLFRSPSPFRILKHSHEIWMIPHFSPPVSISNLKRQLCETICDELKTFY